MSQHGITDNAPVNLENMYPNRPWLGDAAYVGVLGKAAKAFKGFSEADPAGILFSLLALASGAIGSGPHVFAMADHPLVTQVCLIGDKGYGAKGTATDHAADLFERALKTLDPHFMSKHVGNWAPRSSPDFVKRIGDMCVNAEWFKDDMTLEQVKAADLEPLKCLKPRFNMVWRVQEWAGILHIVKMDPDLDVFLRISWQGNDLEAMMGKGWLRLISPIIAIIGNTTPTEFLRTIGGGSIDGGSLTRMLIAFVHQVATIRKTERIPDEVWDKFTIGIREGVRFGRTAGEVTWTPEADRLWSTPGTGLQDRLMRRVLGNQLLNEFFSNRPRVHVPRVAALIALMDKRTKIIESDVKAAYEVLDYAMSSVLFIFETHGERFSKRFAPGMVASASLRIEGNPDDAHENVTAKIRELLIAAGPKGLLISEIQVQVKGLNQYSHGGTKRQDIYNSLAVLRAHIHELSEPNQKGQAGRPGTRYIWTGPTNGASKAPESVPTSLAPPAPTRAPTPAPIGPQTGPQRSYRANPIPPARKPRRQGGSFGFKPR